jgi:steroid delta-isomerase-like uncharacterized protein
MNNAAKNLIEKYYHAFNKNDMPTFLDMLDEHVIHDINQRGRQIGKVEFKKFMTHMERCYKENIHSIMIMTNESGSHAAAEFIIEGIYLATDYDFPEAKHQKYSLPAGAFFEIRNSKITRVTTYYNLNEWIKQIS